MRGIRGPSVYPTLLSLRLSEPPLRLTVISQKLWNVSAPPDSAPSPPSPSSTFPHTHTLPAWPHSLGSLAVLRPSGALAPNPTPFPLPPLSTWKILPACQALLKRSQPCISHKFLYILLLNNNNLPTLYLSHFYLHRI